MKALSLSRGVHSEAAGKLAHRLPCTQEGWLRLAPRSPAAARGLYALPNANNSNADLTIAVISMCLPLIS